MDYCKVDIAVKRKSKWLKVGVGCIYTGIESINDWNARENEKLKSWNKKEILRMYQHDVETTKVKIVIAGGRVGRQDNTLQESIVKYDIVITNTLFEQKERGENASNRCAGKEKCWNRHCQVKAKTQK